MSDHETPSPETASPETASPEAASAEAPSAENAVSATEVALSGDPSAHEAGEHERSSVGGRAPEPEPEERLPARGEDPRPFIVLTAIHDSNARVAAITLSHADAWERATKALAGKDVAGMDIVELPIPPRAFAALREHIQRSPETIAVYDLFPLAAHLNRAQRKVAGQFLAAEILWALEEQGILSNIPLNIRLDVPRSWGDRSPKAVHEKLVEAGALDLTDAAIDDFRAIKSAWDQS
ncbi:MAG: hypothetical protein OHK0013_28900 [Sandaracinaceae bacterium]